MEQEREKEPNRLESLRKLKTSLQADVQKYQAYMSNLESHSAILDQKLNGLDEEISRVELECETMKQENTDYRILLITRSTQSQTLRE